MAVKGQHFTDTEVIALLPWNELVDALRDAFKKGAESPKRSHFTINVPNEPDATLLLMPAWVSGNYIGIKTVTVFPGNCARDMPSVASNYMLLNARDGRLVATFDAHSLTARRTAAASALASMYLSRKNAGRLLVVGTGTLSANLAQAHGAVRDLKTIVVWGRDYAKAASVVENLSLLGIPSAIGLDLEEEVRQADIVSCCTMSEHPLIKGQWLQPGAHLDLVGAFTPTMREADDEAMQIADVYVDTCEGATAEAGEIVQALKSGILKPNDLKGDLFGLTRGTIPGRQSASAITLFKSVGCSLEDLAAATLCLRRTQILPATLNE